MKSLIILFYLLILSLNYNTFAKEKVCETPIEDIAAIFKEFKKDAAKALKKKKIFLDRLEATKSFCRKELKTLCLGHENSEELDLLLKYISQFDNPIEQREILKEILPVKENHKESFGDLIDYFRRFEEKCFPPKFSFCNSERYKKVLGRYKDEIGESGNRYLRANEKVSFYKGIPGLNEAIDETNSRALSLKNNAKYIESLGENYSEGTTSVILNQARKKSLNNVSKGVSDLIGNKGNEFYFKRLNEALTERGLKTLDTGVYLDYKEAAVILDNKKIGSLEEFKRIAEKAADDANRDLRNYIENNYPEVLYLMNQGDRSSAWINTSIMVGNKNLNAKTTEVLNAYRTRLMRNSASKNLTNKEIIKRFNTTGENIVDYMDELKLNFDFVSKGVLTKEGNFTLPAASIMRSIDGSTLDEKIVSLRKALKAKFGKNFYSKSLSNSHLETMINFYEDLDSLALPLRNSDKMERFNENIGVFGGYGIKAGAIDLIEKADAFLAHSKKIKDQSLNENELVKIIEKALVDGDNNATKVIRSAPEIAREAIEKLSESMKREIGFSKVLSSGDDSIVVADSINRLAENNDRFQTVMLNIADNLSRSKKLFLYSRTDYQRIEP